MANPYLLIREDGLDMIAKYRKIKLEGTRENKAEILNREDQKDSSWRTECEKCNLEKATAIECYLRGALKGINYVELPKDITQICKFTFIYLSLQNRKRYEFTLESTLKSSERSILDFFVKKLDLIDNLEYTKYLSPDLIAKRVLEGKKITNLKQLDKLDQRYKSLSTSPNKDLIVSLYDNVRARGTDPLLKIIHIKPHLLESVILNLDKYTDSDICSWLDIVIPVNINITAREYILKNIVSYKNVITRQESTFGDLEQLSDTQIAGYLTTMKDREIFSSLQCYFGYSTRNELTKRAFSAFTEKGFFFPYPVNSAKSINKETLLGTDIEEKSTFFVCYGTVSKYNTYELEELQSSFHHDEEKNRILFRHPEDTSNHFTKKEINDLRDLLLMFESTSTIRDLIALIELGIYDAEEVTEFDNAILDEFANLSKKDKAMLEDFLVQVIDIGMYMRRWKGPPYRYPLQQCATLDKTDPEPKVVAAFIVAEELLSKMTKELKAFCFNLHACNYNNGKIDIGLSTFNGMWNSTASGNYCIRMASSTFIGTAYHYLILFFRKMIPGLDIKQLQHIS